MADLLLCETGNGGDLRLQGNDIVLIEGMHNQVYIGWFGGNLEASTPDGEERAEGEEQLDWWGNELFYPDSPEFQFNSTLEKSLTEVAINSSGRLLLEENSALDLTFLGDFASVSTEVNVIGNDKVEIIAKLQEPENDENKTFSFIWDNTRLEDTCLSCTKLGTGILPRPQQYNENEYSNEYQI